jgi:hypothetical protein
VDQPIALPLDPNLVFRIRPGFPEESGVWRLMNTRTTGRQMPPIASEQLDSVGLALVSDWIETLED